jgi:hypothetical protein
LGHRTIEPVAAKAAAGFLLLELRLAKDDKTADLFEADGVTPKAKAKPAITPELLKAEKRAARAEGKAAGLERPGPAKPAKTARPKSFHPPAELRAQVNDGKITEDQMDETLERSKLRASITSEVKATVSAENTAKAVSRPNCPLRRGFPRHQRGGQRPSAPRCRPNSKTW